MKFREHKIKPLENEMKGLKTKDKSLKVWTSNIYIYIYSISKADTKVYRYNKYGLRICKKKICHCNKLYFSKKKEKKKVTQKHPIMTLMMTNDFQALMLKPIVSDSLKKYSDNIYNGKDLI